MVTPELSPLSPLETYVRNRSPEAFAALVEAYVDLVYSVARRQVGDAHLADDVTQAVFLVLSNKAASVPNEAALPAWLFRTTRYVGRNATRVAARRQIHERKAAIMRSEVAAAASGDDADRWQDLVPALDEAVARLPARDRDAVLLRYYRRLSLREVAEALGMTEDAARKRVSRAVARLRESLAARGVTVPVAALDAALAAHAVTAAPTGQVASVLSTTAGGAGGASASSGAAGLAKTTAWALAWTGAAPAIVATGAAVVIAAAATVMVVNHRTPATSQAVAIAPGTSQPTAPRSPWEAVFEGLGTVRLVGTAKGQSGRNWHAPDGAPMTDAPFVGLTNVILGPQAGPRYRLALRVQGTEGPDVGVRLRTRPDARSLGFTESRQPGQPVLIQAAFDLPQPSPTLDVVVGLAAGPFRAVAQAPVADSAQTVKLPPAVGGTAVTFGPVQPARGGGAETTVKYAWMPDHDVRFFATVADAEVPGMIPSARREPNGPMEATVRFDCAPAAIESVVMKVRDLNWQEIKGVRLEP
jgi:RNA polymerase sigma factor (sigma-70 family)